MGKQISRPNFESINYTIRPGKSVERKMLCEAFARLSILDNIKDYIYIGFGSTYFTDFNLFHKTLGISKLISIEKETDFEDRINFNKPYSCIDVKFGASSEVLPRLPWKDWTQKSIIWLDYTQPLMNYMLGDIRTVISEAKPGSLVLISVNINQDKRDSNENKEGDNGLTNKQLRIKYLEDRVGKEHIPQYAYGLNLNVENNKKVIREIINNMIDSSLLLRNVDCDEEEKLSYLQLFNIHYKDGAEMLTVGGIIHNSTQMQKINEMNFSNLEFISFDDKCFNIVVPNLTLREVHALDMFLPSVDKKSIELPLFEEDIKNYSKIYRYFPNFTEANL
ncbi:hypothetical protein ABID99_004360 [Mucilaginibacter sp. OAE612]|uniref:O-methyltransferase n=1 Tax=Mucilaginibacter sp. OAE612 TaxID=3156444 RepID=UPI00359DE678